MILYTSDLHFGHSNVIGFDHRPFADRDEMDHVLIELWNGRVQPDDTVYIVGDLCFRNENPPECYLRQLKGHKYLIIGNHDQPILDNWELKKILKRQTIGKRGKLNKQYEMELLQRFISSEISAVLAFKR
ncbi:MAG: metallophosphoesterase [Lachnospiraceae bacterium]|nr:metallophosphoesterase [Lachnospiraceae bacterium]